MRDRPFLIADNCTILAPSTMHLPLYREIYLQKGNCVNINVLTPEAYISQNLNVPKRDTLAVLYEYERCLESLPEDNVFFHSRSDYDFLKACFDFLSLVQLYSIDAFPQDNPKERDLKQVIDLLAGVPLWQAGAWRFHTDEADRIWILKAEYPLPTRFFLDQLEAAGAHILGSPRRRRTYYWSASNIRKEMEIAAQTIIDQNLDAEDVLVAVNSQEEGRILSQVFSARNIPFTFLHPSSHSPVLAKWKAALFYLMHPSQEALIDLLKIWYPESSANVRRYLELYPNGSSLQSLAYEENPVLSQRDFDSLVALEIQVQTTGWKKVLDEIQSWTIHSIEAIAKRLQESILAPSQEDLKAFDGFVKAYAAVKEEIRQPEDLQLLYDHLATLHPSAALESISGVLVGMRKDITPLFETVFYIGADAAHFPGLSLYSGIFDEAYMAKLKFPTLQERLDVQKQQLLDVLSLPEELYVLIPQSDYEGKSIEASHEMNTWLGMFAKFQNIPEASVSIVPDFSLNQADSMKLFAPDNRFVTRLSSMNSYKTCPLKHLLRDGLRLRAPFQLQDTLKVRAEIIPEILNAAQPVFHKPFSALSRQEVGQLVHNRLAFAMKVFPDRQSEFQRLQEQYTSKIMQLLQLLSPIQKDWNMELVNQEFLLDVKEASGNVEVEVGGPLASATSGKAVFNLYDAQENPYAPGSKALATLSVALSQPPEERKAFSISYGRGSLPVSTHPIAKSETEKKYVDAFLKRSFVAQDLPEIPNAQAEYVRQKVPTYTQIEEDTAHLALNFLESLKSGCIQPEHEKGSCTYCPFRSICRNGAVEKA